MKVDALAIERLRRLAADLEAGLLVVPVPRDKDVYTPSTTQKADVGFLRELAGVLEMKKCGARFDIAGGYDHDFCNLDAGHTGGHARQP